MNIINNYKSIFKRITAVLLRNVRHYTSVILISCSQFVYTQSRKIVRWLLQPVLKYYSKKLSGLLLVVCICSDKRIIEKFINIKDKVVFMGGYKFYILPSRLHLTKWDRGIFTFQPTELSVMVLHGYKDDLIMPSGEIGYSNQ